jgi:hypothetical protein
LQRRAEIVEYRFQRGRRAGIAVELLQPLIEACAQVGIGAAGSLGPQLPLNIKVEPAR